MRKISKSIKSFLKDKVFSRFNVQLKGILDELDDHRSAINENTGEIQSNYEFLSHLDNKLDKLEQKIEELQLTLSQSKQQESSKKIDIQPLTRDEQRVFLILYTIDKPLSYDDIGKKIGLSEFSIKPIVSGMISKGIPLVKAYINGKAFLKLSNEFKDLQAKENIVKIDSSLPKLTF